MSANFFESASDVSADRPPRFIGDVIRAALLRDGINTGDQAVQVTTIASPASPDNSTEYAVLVNGAEVGAYTTDASATQDELGAGLAAAINGPCTASYDASSNVLTLTFVWPGVAYTVTTTGGSGASALGTPTTSTSAASADGIEFGRLLVRSGTDGKGNVKVKKAGGLTAQVMTFTIASASGAFFHGDVEVNGKVYNWGPVDHNTDTNTTAEDIKDAINAAVPANTVLATRSTADVVLTAEVAGCEFGANIHASGAATASAAKAYTTGPSISTSLARAAFGISQRRLDVENETVDGADPAFDANAVVPCLRRGAICVERDTSETIAAGDEVYVSVASGSYGRFYNSAAANRVWMSPDLLVWDEGEDSSTSFGIATLSANFGS